MTDKYSNFMNDSDIILNNRTINYSELEDPEISEIEKKQNYLIKNIIEKGEDAEKFSDFLASKKENGRDISNWTYEELIITVDEYKSKNRTKTVFLTLFNNIKKVNSEKMEQTEFSKLEDPSINIKKVITKGIFSTSVSYSLNVSPINLTIERTDLDFIYLRNSLRVELPLVHVYYYNKYITI